MRDPLHAAARSIAARPALSVTIVLTLALGIGANATIFSAVDTVLLKPLSYPDADRIVAIYERNLRGRGNATQLVAPGRLEEWNAQNRTFEGLAASYFENMTDASGREPQRIEAMRISPRFFAVLGVAPELGRTPTDAEERFGGPAVVVISDAFWRQRFNRDPDVIGRRLLLGADSAIIIGVMPPSFGYPTVSTEVWRPTQAPPFFLAARSARLYTAFGRLKGNVTIEQAQADLDAVQSRLGAEFPATDAGWGAALVPLKEEQVGGVRRSLWLLFAAVGLVLIAASGNVACLLLASGARRSHEIALRLALGAGRRRLASELLLEGVLLAACGAALALIGTHWGIRALRAVALDLPRVDELHADVRLVAFTACAGLATTMLFAVIPALHASRRDPADALARGGRTHAGGAHRVQQLLVGIQVALAVVLLVGSGLLVRSFLRLQDTWPGFDADHVVTFRMTAAWSEPNGAVVQRHARTLAALEQIRGVESAAISQLLPAAANLPAGEFHIVGGDRSERTFAANRSVSSGYFRTLAIPILAGDTCSADPAAPVNATVLVSRRFAQQYFPGNDALGHEMTAPWMAPAQRARIVGIVGDVRENGVAREAEALIYWCGYNPFWPDPRFLVRPTSARPASMADIRSALRAIEPHRAVYAEQSLSAVVGSTIAQPKANAVLLTAFAASTLALAAMGVYGVLSQLVTERRREIGVRLALGARSRQVVTAVAGGAVATAAVAAIVGLGAAYALARFAGALLYGVSPHDPITFTAVPLLLLMVALASAILPARRAASVEPMEVLRL